MCVQHSTRFQKSDWKAPVFQAGDAQVVPFWGVVEENRFSRPHLPLTVLAFSDTLVPIQRRGEPIGPTSGGPVTRTCSLGRERDSQPRSPSPGFRGGSVNGM